MLSSTFALLSQLHCLPSVRVLSTCVAAASFLGTLGLKPKKALLPVSGCTVSCTVLWESPLAPVLPPTPPPTHPVSSLGELGSGEGRGGRIWQGLEESPPWVTVRQLLPNDLLYALCPALCPSLPRPLGRRYTPPTFVAHLLSKP